MLETTCQADAGRVDLVLMDVMMPEMDGLTATGEIRNRAWGKDLPIIALTAKAAEHDHEQCIAAGANDYLAKPLDIDKLFSLVRVRSEEHTSELQSRMRISYAVFCLKKTKTK